MHRRFGTGSHRLLTPLLLGVALTLGLACSSSNNNSNKSSGAATATKAAASAPAGTIAPASGAVSATAPASAAAGSSATAASSSPAAGGSPTTGGNVTVTPGVVAADKALAAAAGSGSAIDNVTISKPVTITFWHTQPLDGPNGKKLTSLIQDFQTKNPNIQIDAQYVGNYNDLFQKLETAIAGGQAPDMAVAYPNQVAEYQQANVIIPLDDYVKSQKYGLPKDDYADILQAYRYDNFYPANDNKLLSFPFTKSIELMYYNADALKAAGVDVPQTWDDFLKAAKAVAKGDMKGYAIGVEPSLFANMIFSRGGQEISDDQKKWVFNNQQGVDSLAFFQQIIKDGSGYQVAKQFADQTDFGNAKAAFAFSTSAGLPYYQQEVQNDGKGFAWNVAAPPHAAGQPTAAVINGADITMFKSSPEKQLAAWLFMKYFSSKEVNPDWSIASGYLPIRTSGLTDPRVQAQVQKLPQYAIALQVQQYGRSEPAVRSYQTTRNHISDAIVAALSDANKSAKQLLDDAVKQSNDDAAK
ncbi:MAG TPA: ABC transporter substrate-binding protein [Dehalococcoidia bacterium]|nr:ABC transporter substrate-binding protein [Dehalococcoidia bacterium]